MTIDLSALPTIGPDVGVEYIPLNQDTFPYKDLGAQGRYTSRSTPNNLPELLATLSGQRRSDTHGSLLQVDDDHNLYVNVAAGGGGGGGSTAITPGNYVHDYSVQDLDFGGGLTGGVTHFVFDATALAVWTSVFFAIDVKIPLRTGDLPSFRLDFVGSGAHSYWPVALLYPPMPFVDNGWTRAAVHVPFNPPADAVAMGLQIATCDARVWGGTLYGGEAEIILTGLAA